MKKFKLNTEDIKTKINNLKLDKKNINKIVISALLVVALVVQISFLSYLLKGLMPDSEKNKVNALMSYSSKGSLNYRVYLKPNNFINAPYLDAGEAYILDLIDHIKIDSSYNFNSSIKTKVKGSNKMIAKLKVYYKESTDKSSNPEIMKKERTLSEKIINFENNYQTVNNSYNLYLKDYLKTLKDFQDQIKISAEGYLEIYSDTFINGEVGGVAYNNKYSNVMKIPLSGSVIKIENENPEDNTNYVYENDLVKTNKTVMTFIIMVNIIVFIFICILLKKLFKFTNHSEYDKEIKKILKTYDDIVVNTNTLLDIKKYNIIEISEFKEILNLSRELLLPIMNYEVKKGKETWFYVVKDDILYRYIVSEKVSDRANEKEKNKKKKKH